MDIIEDERDRGYMDVCENCGKTALGRRVEAIGFAGESRGFFFICFICFRPRITWRPRGEHSRTYVSPISPTLDVCPQ